MKPFRVTTSQRHHLSYLPAIERAAAELFPLEYLPQTLRENTTSPAAFMAAHMSQGLWVATDASDMPVGFALTTESDPFLFLQEMDVHPDWGRLGIGRLLLQAVIERAKAANSPGVALTTFRDLPWNGPFYRKCGFNDLASTELTDSLKEKMESEQRSGLDPKKRVAMLYSLTPR